MARNLAPKIAKLPKAGAAGKGLLASPLIAAVLSDVVMKAGKRLLDQAIGATAPVADAAASKAAAALPKSKRSKAKGAIGVMASGAAMKLASRSIPGALLVGGGVIAKTLYDRRKLRKAAAASARTSRRG